MGSRIREEVAIVQQLEDLRERVNIIHMDRKSSADILENNKRANAEEIERLRNENKALRSKLTSLAKVCLSSLFFRLFSLYFNASILLCDPLHSFPSLHLICLLLSPSSLFLLSSLSS